MNNHLKFAMLTMIPAMIIGSILWFSWKMGINACEPHPPQCWDFRPLFAIIFFAAVPITALALGIDYWNEQKKSE